MGNNGYFQISSENAIFVNFPCKYHHIFMIMKYSENEFFFGRITEVI